MLADELLNLLRAHSSNPIVSRCLQAIEKYDLKYDLAETLLPLNRVLDVYAGRAQINSEVNNGVIGGFEDLLGSLNNAPKDSFVKIDSLEALSKWFIIFSGEEYSVLFGILESPKKKVAWFDPVKGYDE